MGKNSKGSKVNLAGNKSAIIKALANIEGLSGEKFRELIQAKLSPLPINLQMAYAARCALTALPFLAEKADASFLAFWESDDREKHLLSVFRATQFALGSTDYGIFDIAFPKSTLSTFSTFAFAAADTASAYAAAAYADANAYAAYAAADVANAAGYAATTVSLFDLASAAYSAVYAASSSPINLREWLFLQAAGLRLVKDVPRYLSQPLPSVVETQARWFIAQLHEFGSGFDWWADWYQARLEGKPLEVDLLKQCLQIPQEILGQCPVAVNAYLKSLTRREAVQPLNRVRVIFIGYGQSGKTSLIRALHGETVEPGKEDMTPGIEIREWQVPDTAIKAHFWDFGGQVMAHATHQFFLRERCVYILVMEPRNEINANQQAQYWLEHVRLFGKDAPVLIVGNKADRLSLHLDLHTLKESYPNIVDFFPLSCTGYQDDYRSQFEIFRTALVRALRNTHQMLFTSRHFAVLEDLRQRPRTQAFLDKADFDELCEKHHVAATEDLNRDWLLDLLDKLGVVVHFPGIDWLGAFVLNPRWLTYGVYTLLYSAEAKQAAGKLTQPQAIAILGRGHCEDNMGNTLEFPPIQCRFILDAMQRFELCYPLPNDGETLILPDLLASDRPADLDFDKNQALAFDFDFEALLPRHLMTGFIVRRHLEIHEQCVWQQGVRLRSPHWQADALVQADYHRRRLSLWVAGVEAARYFTILHEEFMAMLKRLDMQPPQYQEWVVLPGVVFAPGREPPRADFRDLLAQEAKGETYHICKYGTFELARLPQLNPDFANFGPFWLSNPLKHLAWNFRNR